MEEVKKAITKQLKGKAKAMEINQAAAVAGYDWAMENLPDQDHIRVVRDNKTQGLIIVDGNEACALGALFAGVTVVGWYPITPASQPRRDLHRIRRGVPQGSQDRQVHRGHRADGGRARLCRRGARCGLGRRPLHDLHRGPGVSLMSEFIGLGYYVEAPARVLQCGPHGAQHGPADPHPAVRRGALRQVQPRRHAAHQPLPRQHGGVLPVRLRRLRPGRAVPDANLRRHGPRPGHAELVLQALRLSLRSPTTAARSSTSSSWPKLKDWGRYKDVDGDGICYRSLPGTAGGKGSYFTRGSGHNAYAQYSEKPEDYVEVVDRLKRKYETARTHVPTPVFRNQGSAKGVLAFGSSDPAVIEAQDILAEGGLKTDYLRLRALPFTTEVDAFVQREARGLRGRAEPRRPAGQPLP